MNREEAIKIIRRYECNSEHYEACDMAIKALEQEPCKDAISRQEAVEAFQMFREYESNRSNKGWVNRIETVLNQLPPVKPQEPSITWVTGADGAKIAFWDVPVWKVTKICEILGEPQESEE